MFTLRRATLPDLDWLVTRVLELNAHENIPVEHPAVRHNIAEVLRSEQIGAMFVISRGDQDIGYALTTFSFDIEFGGREAWLTELYIDEDKRGGGAGTAALPLLEQELRKLGVLALHLQVRRENPAFRLYERLGFEASPRVVMTRRFTEPTN